MVFSFFKKKELRPEEKMPVRPVARPKPLVAPEATPAQVAATAATHDVPEKKREELPVLEFSSVAIPAKPKVTPPAPPKPLPAARTPRPRVPVREPEETIAPELTVSEFERSFTESSVMAINVDHGMDPVQDDIEQVAVLFSNGQDAAARLLLDGFVRTYEGENARRFWDMYFDLLQVTGNKAAFEALSMEFANACEKSPPAWQESRVIHVLARVEPSVFELQGVLTAESAAVLAPVLAAVERKSPVHLECDKLLSCDDEIAGQLTTILQRAAVLKVPLTFAGALRLSSSLQFRMVSGKPQHLASWRLGFELLQRLGDQSVFEKKALEFAVTFEQSPPSWAPPDSQAGELDAPALPKDAYYFSGDIRSCKFDELKPVFEKFRLPVLDFSAVRRMDFFSAGQLANRLGIFRHGGREIVIRSPNHLVAELMGVVGINKYARILVPLSEEK